MSERLARLRHARLLVPARRRVGYLGWIGYQNLGDEAILDACRTALQGWDIAPLPQGRLMECLAPALPRTLRAVVLGGGTLIGTSGFRRTLSGLVGDGGLPAYMLGPGVEDPTFWAPRGRDVHAELTAWEPLLRRFGAVTVRGPRSREVLAEHGIDAEVVGDPALLLGRNLVGKSCEERLLGLNFGLSKTMWGDDPDRLVKEVARFTALASRDGWRIRAFPVWPADVEPLRRVLDRAGVEAETLADFHDPGSVVRSMSDCRVFVGLKLHSVVLASAVGVPSAMVEYAPKCGDFQASLGRGDWTVRTDEVTAAGLYEMVQALDEDHVHHREEIREAVSRARRCLDSAAAAARAGLDETPLPLRRRAAPRAMPLPGIVGKPVNSRPVPFDTPPRNADVTVLIPAWDLDTDLLECVESAHRQEIPCRVLIIDNASTRPLPSIPGTEVLRLARRVSAGAARNAGLRVVETPYVLPLDADDRLLPGAVVHLLDAIESRPGATMAAGCAVPWDPVSGWQAEPSVPSRPILRLQRRPLLLALVNAMRTVMMVSGCALLRTPAAQAVGYADSDFGEDWYITVGLCFLGPAVLTGQPVMRYRIDHTRQTLSDRAARDLRPRLRARRDVRRLLRTAPWTPAWLRAAAPLLWGPQTLHLGQVMAVLHGQGRHPAALGLAPEAQGPRHADDSSAAPTSSPRDNGELGGLLEAAGRHIRRTRNLPAVLPRMAAVREPGRYALNEFRLVPLATRYRLRRSGLSIYVRHHSADGDRLADVFFFSRYRPPAEAARRLAAMGTAPRVLDLAAGVGYFGIWVIGRQPEAHITAIEPDPLAAVMLRRTVRANARATRWEVRDRLPVGAGSLADIDLLRLGPDADAAQVVAAYRSCDRTRLIIVDSSETADLLMPQLRDDGWTLGGRDPLWAWRS